MEWSKFVGTTRYWVSVAVVAVASGAAVGYLVDRYASEEPEPEENPERKSREEIIAEKKSYAEEGTPVVSGAFVKPDISEITDYTKYFDGNRKGSDTDGDEPEAEQEQDAEADASVFEIISEDEFIRATGNEDDYVTATGTYFVEEQILAGWNDKAEPKDVHSTIGEKAAALFEDESVGAVYVRNTHLKVLYEVIRGVGLYEQEE